MGILTVMGRTRPKRRAGRIGRIGRMKSAGRKLLQRVLRVLRALCVLFVFASPLLAQNWGSPEADTLIDRAVQRRQLAFADTLLRDWSARAHGFVFFLAQIREGLPAPPPPINSPHLNPARS